LETIAYSASTQVYLYLTALWVDTAAVGILSAVLVLMNAVNVILLGVMNHAVPVARQRLLVGGYDPWRRWLVRIGVFLTAGVGAFGLLASLAAEPLLTLVYGPAYAASAYLVPIVALQLFLSALNTVLSAAFRTAEMPHVGFAAKVASTLATLLLAYPLLQHWGAAGAAVGLVVTQLLWTATYVGYVGRGVLNQVRVHET
jgi:O-antigen/teichoic acid export membrane protein